MLGSAEGAQAESMDVLSDRARTLMPGGVNSANRVLPWPFVVTRAHGAKLVTSDGREYLDYHAAFGPLVLGHTHRGVDAAVRSALERVDLLGTGVTDLEISLADQIAHLVPSAKRVLLTNSGSEATYAAIRVARAVTGSGHALQDGGSSEDRM